MGVRIVTNWNLTLRVPEEKKRSGVISFRYEVGIGNCRYETKKGEVVLLLK